jgi:hypothetical protein
MYSKMGKINFSEHDSKSSVSIKCWQFIDMLRTTNFSRTCVFYKVRQTNGQTDGRLTGLVDKGTNRRVYRYEDRKVHRGADR